MKRIISLLFAILLIAGAFPFAASADDGYPVIEGTFSYLPAFADVTEEVFYYSDG